MALESAIEFHGLTKEDAYWLITQFYWSDRDRQTAQLSLSGYASADIAQTRHTSDISAIESIPVEFSLTEEPAGLQALIAAEISDLSNPNSTTTVSLRVFNLLRALLYHRTKLEQLRFEGAIDK